MTGGNGRRDNPAPWSRRRALFGLGAATVLGLQACVAGGRRPGASARVLVVGGGYGGATAAKYLRLFSAGRLDVTLVEPQQRFISSPLSNQVLGGTLALEDLTIGYETLQRRHGVKLVHDRVTRIDTDARLAHLAGGARIRYDKLVLSPGIEPQLDAVEGLAAGRASGRLLQAWSAGEETVALRRQLEAMPDGGVFALTVPEAPYRCPPAPYERASLVAAYLKIYKPRSKVLVLDANHDVIAMGGLFKQAWADLYGDLLEYRNNSTCVGVDVAAQRLRLEVQEDVRADVLNILPPVRAGELARQTGLANINARWCEVTFPTFASTQAAHVHVVGDSVQGAEKMPKSGHVANGQAKLTAAAIVAELLEWDPATGPMMTNACYSFVSRREAVHSCAVYRFDASQDTFKPVAGAGGASAARSELEAGAATAWAHNIWSDMLG
jgi:NADPH-dependent 2,4-dienoyl-CoA reductase/sulfur reductase-like enzyme